MTHVIIVHTSNLESMVEPPVALAPGKGTLMVFALVGDHVQSTRSTSVLSTVLSLILFRILVFYLVFTSLR